MMAIGLVIVKDSGPGVSKKSVMGIAMSTIQLYGWRTMNYSHQENDSFLSGPIGLYRNI